MSDKEQGVPLAAIRAHGRLPDPGSPDAPKYWIFETSGVLAAAMRELAIATNLQADGFPVELAEGALVAIRAYCVQWITSPVWNMNPDATPEDRAELKILRMGAERIADTRQLLTWLHLAARAGMDPL